MVVLAKTFRIFNFTSNDFFSKEIYTQFNDVSTTGIYIYEIDVKIVSLLERKKSWGQERKTPQFPKEVIRNVV